jgi:hypothetical protein
MRGTKHERVLIKTKISVPAWRIIYPLDLRLARFYLKKKKMHTMWRHRFWLGVIKKPFFRLLFFINLK